MFSHYLNDYLYEILEGIEERGMQFCIPDEFRYLYKEYLKEKKIRKLIAQIEESIEKLQTLNFK